MFVNILFWFTAVLTGLVIVLSFTTLLDGVNWSMFFSFLIFGAALFLFLPIYFCGSMKKGLAAAKINIDYLNACIEKLTPAQRQNIEWEAADFFKGFDSRWQIHFGKDCLYGRVLNTNWKQTNYSVILPYEHIKQIVVNKKLESAVKQKLSAAATIATAAISVAALAAGGAGFAVFYSYSFATFLIVDDNDHVHKMSIGTNDAKTHEKALGYIEQIISHAPKTQICYADN